MSRLTWILFLVIAASCGSKPPNQPAPGPDTDPISPEPSPVPAPGPISGTDPGQVPPPGECFATECGPQLGMATMLCPDGVNRSGPSGRCLRAAGGACQWEMLACPGASVPGASGPPTGTPPVGSSGDPNTPGPGPTAQKACIRSGCSGAVCVEPGHEVMTTCEWREAYACYRTAACERQRDGRCGWTMTPALQACLKKSS